ncbi:unnamed protein product [Paramecium octaurelia]|uniref:Uncharacterized protein n=1 Tax=Paramecium octaurelia TaxID=43137 RepID=A0A8S1W3V5_PAROT|nr:unnamed protein product [Paramecium octaurelia]
MVCIPCLVLPLVGILVVLFDFIKPFLIKIGLVKAPPKTDDKNNTQENRTKVLDTPTPNEPEKSKSS